MRTFLTFLALTGALGLAQPLFVSPSFAAPQLDQSNLGAVTSGTAFRDDFVAQVITVGRPGILVSVDLAVRKFPDDPNSSGDITLEIRGVNSGVPDGPVLASKNFARVLISTLPDEFTNFDLRSLNLTFNVGDVIAVAVASKNIIGSSFPIALSNDLYTGGDFWGSFVDGGGATIWFSFNRDTRFRTFVEDPVKTVGIDIKPGSDPNCFNVNGHGVIPVAILGSVDFDPSEIVDESLNFAGFEVRMRGSKGPLCSLEDVNSDGIDDLVCHFEDDGSDMWDPNDNATATLMGVTMSGTQFEGEDSICVKPE